MERRGDDPFGDFNEKTPKKVVKTNFDDFDVFGEADAQSKEEFDPFADKQKSMKKETDPFADVQEDNFFNKNSKQSSKTQKKNNFFDFSKKKAKPSNEVKNNLNDWDDPFDDNPKVDLKGVQIKQVESFTGHSLSRTRQTGHSESQQGDQRHPKKVRTLGESQARIGIPSVSNEKIKSMQHEIENLKNKLNKVEQEKDHISGKD
jgi:hypothetical protein